MNSDITIENIHKNRSNNSNIKPIGQGYYDDTTLKVLKTKAISQIEIEIELLKSIQEIDELLTKTKNSILEIYEIKKKRVESASSTYSVFYIQVPLDTKIISILKAFAKEYCHKYNIYVNYEKLDYTSLSKLYQELINLKERALEVETTLQKEADKYQIYPGYKVVRNNILKIKNKTSYIVQINSLNIEVGIADLNHKVIQEFKSYYQRVKELKRLKELYKDINSKRIQILLIVLERNITDENKFRKTIEDINNYINSNIKVKLALYFSGLREKEVNKQERSLVRKRIK